MEPAASASVPTTVPVRPRSKMIRASMGNAVIDIAAPMNGTACAAVTLAAKKPPRCNSNHASPHPSANGASIPEAEIASADRRRECTRSIRNSNPTVNM